MRKQENKKKDHKLDDYLNGLLLMFIVYLLLEIDGKIYDSYKTRRKKNQLPKKKKNHESMQPKKKRKEFPNV